MILSHARWWDRRRFASLILSGWRIRQCIVRDAVVNFLQQNGCLCHQKPCGKMIGWAAAGTRSAQELRDSPRAIPLEGAGKCKNKMHTKHKKNVPATPRYSRDGIKFILLAKYL